MNSLGSLWRGAAAQRLAAELVAGAGTLRVCVACMGQARLGEGAAAQRLAAELVAGINHVQYNQGNDINAFAGMVSSTRACTDVHAVSHRRP